MKSFVFLLLLFAVAPAGIAAQATVRIEATSLQGPRPLPEQTARAAIRDYLHSWQSLQSALEQNRAELLDADFVGDAKDKLTTTIQQQAALGMRAQYRDRTHDLRIVFYSPDGLSLELTDEVEYSVQVFDHDKVGAAQQVHARYIVVMTPAAVRWRVRVFQALPEDTHAFTLRVPTARAVQRVLVSGHLLRMRWSQHGQAAKTGWQVLPGSSNRAEVPQCRAEPRWVAPEYSMDDRNLSVSPALALQQVPDATLAMVGNTSGGDRSGAQRAANVKAYLAQQKCIDSSRVAVDSGSAGASGSDITLIPPGAKFDSSATSPAYAAVTPIPRTNVTTSDTGGSARYVVAGISSAVLAALDPMRSNP